MIKRMHHTGIVVSDLERAVAFYRDGAGLEVQSRYERIGAAIEQVVGYEDAHLLIAVLGLGGEHLLELIQYVSPPPADRPTAERAVLGAALGQVMPPSPFAIGLENHLLETGVTGR